MKDTSLSMQDYMEDDLLGDAPWPSGRSSSRSGKYRQRSYAPPCHHSHEAFTLGGGTVRGGNCDQPKAGYDIYVGLDYHMTNSAPFPWENFGKDVIDIHYPIQDMGAPKNVAEFKQMVTWLALQLSLGKKLHVGCIGGHGRTGLLLAALLAECGDTDAIHTVRKVHCKRAVESKDQIDFLVKHYGVKSAEATKSYAPAKSYTPVGSLVPLNPHAKAYRPFHGARTIWGKDP